MVLAIAGPWSPRSVVPLGRFSVLADTSPKRKQTNKQTNS